MKVTDDNAETFIGDEVTLANRFKEHDWREGIIAEIKHTIDYVASQTIHTWSIGVRWDSSKKLSWHKPQELE